jgi:hypothetical protein
MWTKGAPLAAVTGAVADVSTSKLASTEVVEIFAEVRRAELRI